MVAQFARFETFARKSSLTRRTSTAICAEAARMPGFCPHVLDPKQPLRIFGIDPIEIMPVIEAQIAVRPRANGRGRGTRKDTHVLGGMVFSYPISCLELTIAETLAIYHNWRASALKVMQGQAEQYKMTLLSVVEHLDETYPHIHGLFVANNKRNDIKICHPGHAASVGLKMSKTQRLLSYKKAMSLWQDDIFRELSVHYGHTRFGPRRQRLTSAEYRTQKTQAALIAAQVQLIKIEREKLTEENCRLDNAADRLERKSSEITSAEHLAENLDQKANAILTAVQAYLTKEINDSDFNESDESQSGLVFAVGLTPEREDELMSQIGPNWQLACKTIRQLAANSELARTSIPRPNSG